MEFNKTQLSELLTSFYAVTEMKIAIKDNQGKELLSVPERNCTFCEKLRENAVAERACSRCDERSFEECKRTDSIVIYNCHSGLTEAMFPLKIDQVNIGYVMFGQIAESETFDTKKTELLEKAKQYTDKITIEDIACITRKSREQIKHAANILKACACFSLTNHLLRFDYGGIAFKISNYIYENLDTDLSVTLLCERFQLSRNMLYAISKRYFGMPIAQYIRKRRVSRAVEYIKSGISVSMSADLVGFNDYSYFTKVVKKETGYLPGYWAKHRDC